MAINTYIFLIIRYVHITPAYLGDARNFKFTFSSLEWRLSINNCSRAVLPDYQACNKVGKLLGTKPSQIKVTPHKAYNLQHLILRCHKP